MWLLSTDRAELHYFISPVHVQDGYAILSHVWNNEEQSFKDVRKIIKTCTSTGENPRDLVSAKIRRCCELAESHGFKWIWNDTCCIDKSSSAELSEAINSMFQYYAMSRMCYAYLEDVPSARPFVIRQDDRSWTRKSYFSGSNWHLRGWTLQELIAPRTVLFISQDWVPLGTKVDLAAQLEDATGIPRSILTLDRSVNDFSIAQRMSWAAERRTTRVEDEAYSLLGIFEISMPIMYGEGRNAFLRLQEEIMRRSTDTTLFAWGPVFTDEPSLFSTVMRRGKSRLFAASPAGFLTQGRTTYTKPTPQASGKQVFHSLPSYDDDPGKITCTKTAKGVLARIPLIELRPQSGLYVADLGWSEDDARILLILWRVPPNSHERSSTDRPEFLVGSDYGHWRTVKDSEPRAAGQSQSLSDGSDSAAVWTWTDVHLLHDPVEDQSYPIIPINHSFLHAPFHFPESSMRQFMASLTTGNPGTFPVYIVKLDSARNVSVPWSGSPPATFRFSLSVSCLAEGSSWSRSYRNCLAEIRVGQCPLRIHSSRSQTDPAAWLALADGGPSDSPGGLWANTRAEEEGDATAAAMLQSDSESEHSCPGDHVHEWTDMRKCFSSKTKHFEFHFVLSFSPSSSLPTTALQLGATMATLPRCDVCGLYWQPHNDLNLRFV